jgi:hypothetical protein
MTMLFRSAGAAPRRVEEPWCAAGEAREKNAGAAGHQLDQISAEALEPQTQFGRMRFSVRFVLHSQEKDYGFCRTLANPNASPKSIRQLLYIDPLP